MFKDVTTAAMHLYIRSSAFSTEVPEICLLDGHIPAIGNLTPDLNSTDDMFPTMEPAVWFKVSVIDSVSIDCTKRVIHWNSLFVNMEQILVDVPPTENGGCNVELRRERQKRVSESMYVGGECYGYHNDLDELFDSTQQLLDSYASSNISCNTFHKQIFALLHCYVLPNIKLNTDDIQELGQVLEKQGSLIDSCNQEILAKYAKLDEVARSMKRQRQMTYVEELTKSPQKNLNYPAELIKCLQKDLDVDIREEWAKIESQNEEIQTLKADSDPDSSSSGSSDKPNELELSAQRQERDNLLKNYEHMISARESLHAMANGGSVVAHPPPGRWSKRKKKFSRKKAPPPPNPLHNIYIELHNKFQEMENEIMHTTTKKVRLISVKEAVKSTIAELKDSDESYGVDLDQTGSQRPTDVLRHSKIPRHWQTLTEKVASFLNKGGSITKQFQEFQMQMLNQCQGLLDEHENLLKSVPLNPIDKETGAINPVFVNKKSDQPSVPIVHDVSCFPKSRFDPSEVYREAHQQSLASFSATEDSTSRHLSDFIFVFNRESDYLKRGIENIHKSIHKHFDVMVGKFLTKLKMDKTTVNQRKVWLCYESYFYEAVMPMLVKVYDKAYASSMLNLQDLMPKLTIDDLNVEDTFLIHLLTPCEPEEEMCQAALTSDSSAMDSPLREDSNEHDLDDRERKEDSSGAVGDDAQKTSNLHTTNGFAQDFKMQDVTAQDSEKPRSSQQIQGLVAQRQGLLLKESEDSNLGLDSVFHEETQEKTESSDCILCEDVREDSSDSLSCDDVREKNRSSDTDSYVEHEPVFESELRPDYSLDEPGPSRDDFDCSGDFDVRPRLEMLPSIFTLSSSSLSSDSNGDLRTSDINLKLLQEAEDIVAGLKTLKEKEVKPASAVPLRTHQRTMSTPDRDTTIPKALETGDTSNIIRQIKVYHPTSVTVVYHRCTWPIPHAAHTYKHIDPSVECAEDALQMDNSPERKSKASPSDLRRYKMVKFRPEIAVKFQGAFDCLTSVITETAPLLKLQGLTSCLRSLNHTLTEIQRDMGKNVRGASTDDLIDLLVLLICNYDPVLSCRLYPQITLLSEVMAPFFEGGPYSFSLVQFSVAYQFLQEKMVLKQSIADNARVRRDLESDA